MKDFTWRKYVSVGLALSFFMIVISGLVLYIAPPGRVARWINWIMIGLNRAQWENQHTLFSYLFILFGLIHLFSMNWRLFLTYIKNGIARRIRSKREPIAALLTVLIIFFFTLFEIPPVITIMNIGNNISDIWSDKIGEPPIPGIEDMPVYELADRFFESDSEKVLNQIRENGFEVENISQTIKDISATNNAAPMDVFRSLGIDLNDSYSR